MRAPQSITELPPSPSDERRGRMIRYAIAMSIRMLCVIACFFVQGWWLLVPAVGAIVLPYVAVVLANAKGASRGSVERPGTILQVAHPGDVR